MFSFKIVVNVMSQELLIKLCEQLENVRVRFNDEYYKMYAGLDFSKDTLKKLSEEKYKISIEILKRFNEPRRLYLAMVYTVVEHERLDIDLKLYEEKGKKIVDEKYLIDGKPVNWNTWRQFNARTEDHKARKHVFDTFISKVPLISPLEEKLFNTSKEIMARYGTNPLDAYLEFEGLSYESLISLVDKLGSFAKSDFQKALEYYSMEILKKPAEYYDDLYLFRGKIYRPINKYFEGIDPIKVVSKVLTGLGFDLTKIKVDGEDRPRKHPSAMCWGIQIPNDVRILFKPVSPFTDITSVFHEFGHGIHGASAIPTDPYWKRYLVSMGVAETFSILIETLMDTPEFVKQTFKLDNKIVQNVINRRHFMNLFFLTFYVANSTMKLKFWKYNYTLDEANNEYEALTEKYMGIRIPGRYWQLHHVMSEYDLYSPSYLIAAVRVGELVNKLVNEYGTDWWQNKEAGEFIKELASQRADIDLSWSKLEPKYYISYFAKVNL